MLLLSSALIFVAVGAVFLAFPQQYGQLLELSLPTAMARTDVRATYGGLELGLGVFLILCVVRREWTRAGLWALALATGGFAAGRIVGLAFERTISSVMAGFLALEIVVTLLAVFVLLAKKRAVGT